MVDIVTIGVAVAAIILVVAAYISMMQGTKEKSFEDAIAEQRMRERQENTSKGKKPKGTSKKPKQSRPRASTQGQLSPSVEETPGQSTEDDDAVDDSIEQRERALIQQQEQNRRAAAEKDRQRQMAEKEKQRQVQAAEKEKQKQIAAEKERKEKEKREKEEKEKREKEERDTKEREAKEKKEREEREEAKRKELAAIQEQEAIKAEKKKSKQENQKKKPMTNGVFEAVMIEETMSAQKMERKMVNGKKSKREDSPLTLSEESPEINGVAKKNKKNTQKDGVSNILKVVEKAQLSSEQATRLVDSLLLMNTTGGWNEARKTAEAGPSKKLEDALGKITLLQETEATLMNKISELRGDLNSERSKNSSLKKQIEGASAEQQKVLERETRIIQQNNQQIMASLQEKTKSMQIEYEDKLRQLEASTLEAQRVAREETAQHVSQQQHAAVQQISDLQSQLQSSQFQTQSIQSQLEQMSSSKKEVDTLLVATQQEVKNLTNMVERQQVSMEQLQIEKKNLEELAQESVRSAADGQENEAIQNEKTQQELLQKSEQLDQLHKEIERLKSELSNSQNKNDELRNKNSTVIHALTSTEEKLMKEKSTSEELRSQEESYRELLKRLHPTVSVDDKLDNATFLQQFKSAVLQEEKKEATKQDSELQKRLSQLTEENNNLIEKTKKLECSLRDTNNSLSELKREKEEYKKKVDVMSSVPKSSVDEGRVAALTQENSQLQEKLTHCQEMFSGTEAMLSNLQNSVDSETNKWKVVVAQKDKELSSLRAQYDALKTKVEKTETSSTDDIKVQSELEQIRKEKSDLEDKLSALQKEKSAATSNGPNSDESSTKQ